MLRISWPLAIVAAGAIAIVARRPKLLSWVLIAFGIWFAIEVVRNRRR
jgi:tellurite resistance protein TehA-like permease